MSTPVCLWCFLESNHCIILPPGIYFGTVLHGCGWCQNHRTLSITTHKYLLQIQLGESMVQCVLVGVISYDKTKSPYNNPSSSGGCLVFRCDSKWNYPYDPWVYCWIIWCINRFMIIFGYIKLWLKFNHFWQHRIKCIFYLTYSPILFIVNPFTRSYTPIKSKIHMVYRYPKTSLGVFGPA